MRIIIIDDDIKLNESLKLSLEQRGYAVDSFTDSIEAEKYLLVNNMDYDLIILDWMMPGKTGLEICKKLRENNIFIPILMLSSVNALDSKVSVLDSGADDYLTKPFLVPELFAHIRALLRRPVETKPTIINVGNISLNTATRKVTVGKKDVTITLKEFGILEYLMLHFGQVIGRDMILDHVWDMGFVSFSNVVDVRINSLRKKLGHKGNSEIETIRGVGYKLDYK
jgi:two-component system OmpR family response regulator